MLSYLRHSFNPYRVFSGAATQSTRMLSGSWETSFNPYRVFSGAATEDKCYTIPGAMLFQSLSGFLGRCNTSCFPHSSPPYLSVSIPIGFSRGLQRDLPRGHGPPLFSFNPYRVFSGAATIAEGTPNRPAKSFNPYRVFSGAATTFTSDVATGTGFNPYRVFSGASTLWRSGVPVSAC